MKPHTQAVPISDFQHRVRIVTLIIVVLTAFTQVMLQPFWSPIMTVRDTWCSEGLLLLFGLWTWFAPSYRWSTPVRLGALLLEISVIVGASLLGMPRLYYFVYMCIIAKAALQLQFKGLAAIMIAVLVAHISTANAKTGAYYHYLEIASRAALPGKYPPLLHAEIHLYFIFAMIVVAAMARAMVAERENRMRAERLSDEVEDMVVKYERARISRDIHDALGHTLTSLNIQLDVASTMYEKNEKKAREALVSAKQLAANSLADVRRSVHMIRDEDGSSYNLKESVTALVSRARLNHDVEISLDFDLPDLPLFKSHNLFCIVQESLTNAQRHASAKKIGIALNQQEDQLVLRIIDDGAGFDVGSQMQGLGLQSIRERVQLLGGTLVIDSAPDSGTQVNVRVPIGMPVAT